MIRRFDVSTPEQLLEVYKLAPLKKHAALLSNARVWRWDLDQKKASFDPEQHKWSVSFYQDSGKRVAEVNKDGCIFPLAVVPYNKALSLCRGWTK